MDFFGRVGKESVLCCVWGHMQKFVLRALRAEKMRKGIRNALAPSTGHTETESLWTCTSVRCTFRSNSTLLIYFSFYFKIPRMPFNPMLIVDVLERWKIVSSFFLSATPLFCHMMAVSTKNVLFHLSRWSINSYLWMYTFFIGGNSLLITGESL